MKQSQPNYPEEGYAKQLHSVLIKALSKVSPPSQVSFEGSGVHWQCLVRSVERDNSIACFDQNGPEYYVSFNKQGQQVGTGRTPLREETVSAVAKWISGYTLEDLYAEFAFVDRVLRSLTAIRAHAMARVPKLAECAPPEMKHEFGDHYELWFRGRERACRISFYGKNQNPDLFFQWDGCEMFRIQTQDSEIYSDLLGRWLCDMAAPSQVKSAVPMIDISQVAKYYEEGRPVEGEFICSWDAIEHFYGVELSKWRCTNRMLELVGLLRKSGRDRTLRAGQSMYTLMLSRSRRHGLRSGQHSIAIDVDEKGMTISGRFAQQERFSSAEVGLVPEFERLLKQLEAEPIS